MINSFNQRNNGSSIESNNQIRLNKSENFQEGVSHIRLMIWNRFLAGVANNSRMIK